MRRLMLITAFALSLAVPLWAQHGGGRVGGGGHIGLSGGHAGFGGHGGGLAGHGGGFSGPRAGGGHIGPGHVGGGHLSGPVHSRPGLSRNFARVPSAGRPRFTTRDFHHRHHNRFFNNFGFNNCWGWGCGGWWGYPWYAGYYDPWWWNDSSYDDDYEQDLANANEMNRQSLEEQRMLRQEEADGDQDVYARSAQQPKSDPQEQGAPMMPATVLVFRDQHQREIQNYAIVGQTLWNFAPQRTEKIPLADLDLTATAKANDDRGLSFRLPNSTEAR